MKRATEATWMAMLTLLLGGALVLAGCGDSKDDDDEDTTTTDTATEDMGGEEDVIPDSIPDPSTEPPEDTTSDSEEDTAGDSPTDVPVDGAGNPVGGACTDASDCGGGLTMPNCLTDLFGIVSFPGGYCSGDCTSNDDCGPDGECLNLFIMTACVKMCDADSDCREAEGYACGEPPFIGGGPYCLPDMEMPEIPPDGTADVIPDVPVDTGSDMGTD